MHLGLNQRLGLSRNKVAVPEGVAGTPPFWNRVLETRSFHTLKTGCCQTFILLVFSIQLLALNFLKILASRTGL